MAMLTTRSSALLVLALVAVASPALAQPRQAETSRAAAIHQCNGLASRYPEYLWGNLEFDKYRACMAERGRSE